MNKGKIDLKNEERYKILLKRHKALLHNLIEIATHLNLKPPE